MPQLRASLVCVLRRIGTFTWQGRDFGAWPVTIARNLAADHFKSGRLEVTTSELLEAGEAESSAEDRVLQLLPNADLLNAVRRIPRSLAPGLHRLLTLGTRAGIPQRVPAANAPVSAVAARLLCVNQMFLLTLIRVSRAWTVGP
jgi:hypothetical protein